MVRGMLSAPFVGQLQRREPGALGQDFDQVVVANVAFVEAKEFEVAPQP